MRVALVHSWLNQYGGAERVLEVLHELYPQAPIYTSMYWPQVMPAAYRSWDIRASFMQRLPLVKRHHQPFMPLYPLAFEQFDLHQYDLVLSVSSAFSHGVITRPQTCHICYCLTPARFLWNYHEYSQRERIGRLGRAILPLFLTLVRLWDLAAAARVDHFLAISREVAARIAKFYRREAAVIYPPVNINAYQPSAQVDNFFLVVSRLIPYKRIDLAVEAFNQLGLPLKIVGDGRDRAALQAMARDNVEFLGRVSDREVKELYARCQALIFPGEEDFGLTPLEAQASGRPVIAYAGGGALETILEGHTGFFFREQRAEALAQAVRAFDPASFRSREIRQQAEQFDVSVFKAKLQAFVQAKMGEQHGAALELVAR